MRMIAEEIIIRSIQKTSTPEELDILNKWMKEDEKNAACYFQLEEIWNSRKNISEETIHNGWQTLAEQITLRPQKEHSLNSSAKKQKIVWLRYAAAVFIGILITSAVWMIFYDAPKKLQPQMFVQNVVYNNAGVHPVVLPDNSEVWLNENSKIIYPEAFAEKNRVVALEGKAYFDIQKDSEKPFIVQIGNVEIEVTGTEFFVESAPEEESTVTLISGKVNLNYKDKDGRSFSTSLTPGEQAHINSLNGSVAIENIDTDYYIAWKDGTYRFTDEPLEKITPLLAKRFDLDIHVVLSLRNKRFTGRVVPGEDIEDILKSIRKSYPIKYQISGKKVNISI